KPEEAIRSWEAAVDALERGRARWSPIGLERSLKEGDNERSYLALALARQGQPHEAWRNWEADLGRGLLDDLSARRLRPLTADQRRREGDLRGRLQALDEQIGRLAAGANPTRDEDERIDHLHQQQGTLRGELVALENELNARYLAFTGTPAS